MNTRRGELNLVVTQDDRLLEPRKNPTMNAANSTTIVILSIDAKNRAIRTPPRTFEAGGVHHLLLIHHFVVGGGGGGPPCKRADALIGVEVSSKRCCCSGGASSRIVGS